MGFMGLVKKVQKTADDYKKKQAEKKAAEEQRQNKILEGKIEPVPVKFNLNADEAAYISVPAKRLADVEYIVEKTSGKNKKKGVIRRGIVGGVLLGPAGMIAGAATAGSKIDSKTVQEIAVKHEPVDQGEMILTNKRMVFVGKQVFELPYSKVLAYSFSKSLIGSKLNIKYEGMLPNEEFQFSGTASKDMELYYRGVTEKIAKYA